MLSARFTVQYSLKMLYDNTHNTYSITLNNQEVKPKLAYSMFTGFTELKACAGTSGFGPQCHSVDLTF